MRVRLYYIPHRSLYRDDRAGDQVTVSLTEKQALSHTGKLTVRYEPATKIERKAPFDPGSCREVRR